MRLKSLELQGFKSFPDKTTLNFDAGVTVVVGPNGSGKSNISDAVRWVLGEISSRNIRGTKLEDVIFGGSDNRRQTGFAEVSLVIDNTVGQGRLDSDFDEVTVTRRYYRSGESEYEINRKAVRLKDITELFMNTGIGKTGYSIIGQGRIAEIISAKSDERRTIFEEAAGISKFRYKKGIAERDLTEVDANLVRLSDILDDLTARVGPLEKEAERARVYLELYERKKAADVSLWLYDTSAVRESLAEAERSFAAAGIELESIDSDIASFEAQSERRYETAAQCRVRIDETERRIADCTEKMHEAESRRLVGENDILHIREQLRDAKAAGKALSEELERNERERDAQSEKFSDCAGRLAALSDRLCEAQTAEDNASTAQAEAEEAVFNAGRALHVIEDELSALRVKIAALEAQRENEAGLGGTMGDELSHAEEEAEMLSARCEKARVSLAGYAKRIGLLGGDSDSHTRELAAIEAERDACRERFSRISLDISTAQQRSDALRRMEELFEGYNQSVRVVLESAADGSLTGIRGTVSQLITVKPEHSIAVETALGASIQNIVVDDEAAAKAAINLLIAKRAGRATFCPLTSLRPQPLGISVNELSRYKGFVGVCSELAVCDQEFLPAINYSLGRTVVFDNIDNASDFARKNNYRTRAVTLNGQLINAGGTYTGGSVKRDSGILTRSGEIAALKEKITRLSAERRAEGDKISALNGKYDAMRKAADDSGAELTLLRSLESAENTQYQVMQNQLENCTRRRDELQNQLHRLGERAESYNTQRELLKNNEAELLLTIDAGNAESQRLREVCSECELGLAEARKAVNALRLEYAVAEHDRDVCADALEKSGEAAERTRERLARGDEAITEFERRLGECAEAIKEGGDAFSGFSAEIEQLRAEREEALAESGRQEQKINELRAKIKEDGHRRELLFREYTRLESRVGSVTAERDRLASSLWDEYELTYTAAVELDYPAVNAENRAHVASEQSELRSKIKRLGTVNVNAIDEYREVRDRCTFTEAQVGDLRTSRDELDAVIGNLEKEMRGRFSAAIESVNAAFGKIFRELFGGGSAQISLTDGEDVLTAGVDIFVAPPGKIIKNLISLSGGEQAFVAIALLFAILETNPTPFCIFDEIESALDEVNVTRFAEYMHHYSSKTQFIVISHRRGTMDSADMLYGVTMPERGVSKVLSMNVAEAEQRLGIKFN